MRNNEQGRSMIEMLGVLAIVGVLSVGGIAGYSKAMNKFKSNKLIDQITTISTNVKTIFSGQRTYNGLTLKVAGQVGILPAETYDATEKDSLGSGEVKHAFNGDIYLEPTGLNADDDEMAYLLTITGIPREACIAALTTDFGVDDTVAVGTDDGVNDVYTSNASSVSDNIGSPSDTSNPAPFSVINATTACASTSDNTVYFKFK